MYYEEKIIRGVLMCKTRPDGYWRQCSIESMSERIVALEQENRKLKEESLNLESLIEGDGYNYNAQH